MYNEKLAPPCHIVRNFPLHRRNNHISLQVYGLSFIIPAAKQIATVAQLVEQTIRNRQVMGSNPIGGSINVVVFPLKIGGSGRKNHFVLWQNP